MTRNEAATILAQSLLDAGYRYDPTHRSRQPWICPDGYRASRLDLKAHVVATYHGDDRDPYLDFLGPTAYTHWLLVDKAAKAHIQARP